MCRLAYVILGDAHGAEEVVMEALLKTFSGWGRLRNPERGGIYLKRAVVNGCRSRIRRRTVEARVNALAHGRDQMRAADWDPGASDTRSLVWDAVKALPERQRACVVLRYLEDLSEAEIAAVLECSVGTVKSQLAKARSKLAVRLRTDDVGGERDRTR